MNRFLARFSLLMVAATLALGCGKKKEEAKTEDPGAAAPAAGTATTPPADPAAAPATPPAEPAAAPAGGGGGQNYTVDEACDKSIAMLEAMGNAVTSNKGNCDGMGDALQKWADENKDFIAWGKAHDQDPAMKKEFDEKCTPKMTAAMEKVGPAMGSAQECATNEKVKTALSALE